jgi:hypothetical protein
MKVKDIIKNLKKLDPESEIIHAWWDKDAFPDVADKDWSDSVDRVDREMNWSETHYMISFVVTGLDWSHNV